MLYIRLALLSLFFFFLMIRRPPRSTLSSSSAASDVYKRQAVSCAAGRCTLLYPVHPYGLHDIVLLSCAALCNHVLCPVCVAVMCSPASSFQDAIGVMRYIQQNAPAVWDKYNTTSWQSPSLNGLNANPRAQQTRGPVMMMQPPMAQQQPMVAVQRQPVQYNPI
eukprot:TRINITY_DN8144_c0_g1_i1.p1 TRINITY_DN8144_c0_g1~~TRINITY_DN8144_c0_g1_i1.p1  ORF type:complete len:164 (-),score=29.67 TRINITY_DN8144_c0_g1_i1:264-755(-)